MKKNWILLLCLFITSLGWGQQTMGLFQATPDAFQGYTLFSPDGHETYLIDNCGRKVHGWTGVADPGAPPYILKDGSMIKGIEVYNPLFGGMGGAGGGVEHYDWDGNVIWSFIYSNAQYDQHHEIEPLPNGNFLLLAWEVKTVAEAISLGREPSTIGNDLWCEKVVEVQPVGMDSGIVVWEWHLWDHLIQDYDPNQSNYGNVFAHPELLDINANAPAVPDFASRDWIHANNVTYNPALDQIMVNSQRLSEFYVIDHSTTTAEAAAHTGGNSGKGGDILYRWGNPQWYRRGTAADQQLFREHNAHWIPPGHPHAGKIMVFNNGLDRPAGAYSSVDIIDPPVDAQGNYALQSGQAFGPAGLTWTYVAPNPTDFYSSHISSAQMQPNGNVLINEGNFGHIFEVTPAGETVWEYTNPVYHSGVHTQGSFPFGNGLFRAHRYPLDYIGFRGRDLTPGDPIEVNPLPLVNGCDGIVGIPDEKPEQGLRAYPNPVGDFFWLEWQGTQELNIEIFNPLGRLVWEGSLAPGTRQIPSADWPAGVYRVRADLGGGISLVKW